jgi:hypothetical protein
MAQPRDFATLMVKIDARKKFIEAKKKMESQLGVTLTNSNALDVMCDQILSDSITLSMKLVPLQGESK